MHYNFAKKKLIGIVISNFTALAAKQRKKLAPCVSHTYCQHFREQLKAFVLIGLLLIAFW